MEGSYWEQAGVVPWRWRGSGREVLLITSRRTGQWGVPKGMIEAHLGIVGSAIEEAWEEAGVRGEIDARTVGHYTYEKWGRACRVAVFPMRVLEVLDAWPEMESRDRRWVALEDAPQEVGEPDLARVLAAFASARATPAPRVSWVPTDILRGPGRIGVCSIPGERAHGLDEDLAHLASTGVRCLVCLVEPAELASLEPPETVAERATAVSQAGMAFLAEPVEDFRAPRMEQAGRVVAAAREVMAEGGSVVMHCWAGLGRAGTMLACVLVDRGMTAEDAIVTTRWVRPGAIQSHEQEAFVHNWAARLSSS